MISPHSAAYVSEMRKVSSESDSIVGFGEEGNATRHYTEVRFQLKGYHWQLATTSMLATGQTVLSSTSGYFLTKFEIVLDYRKMCHSRRLG